MNHVEWAAMVATFASSWVAYSPASSNLIEGRFTVPVREDNDEEPEPQKIVAWCPTCGAFFHRTCPSQRAIDHLERFGRVHAHETTLSPPGLEDLDEPLGPTPLERRAIETLAPIFERATRAFLSIKYVDPPEDDPAPPEVLTPARCRALLATVVLRMAELFELPTGRLDWLAQQMLCLTLPSGKWVELHTYLAPQLVFERKAAHG